MVALQAPARPQDAVQQGITATLASSTLLPATYCRHYVAWITPGGTRT